MNRIVFCGKLDIKCLEIYTKLVNPDHSEEMLRMSHRPWPVKGTVYVTFMYLTHFFTEYPVGFRLVWVKVSKNPPWQSSLFREKGRKTMNKWTSKLQESSSIHSALMKINLMRKAAGLLRGQDNLAEKTRLLVDPRFSRKVSLPSTVCSSTATNHTSGSAVWVDHLPLIFLFIFDFTLLAFESYLALWASTFAFNLISC